MDDNDSIPIGGMLPNGKKKRKPVFAAEEDELKMSEEEKKVWNEYADNLQLQWDKRKLEEKEQKLIEEQEELRKQMHQAKVFLTDIILKIALIIIVIAGTIFLLPHGYYTFLRWSVGLYSFVFCSVRLTTYKHDFWWVFFFVCAGILFNPIVKIYLSINMWKLCDVVFIIGMIRLTWVDIFRFANKLE